MQWVNSGVTSSRKKQLASLRDKYFDDKETAGHKVAQKVVSEAKKSMKKVILKQLYKNKETTAKVSRTLYNTAKESQSFYNFEREIDLQ